MIRPDSSLFQGRSNASKATPWKAQDRDRPSPRFNRPGSRYDDQKAAEQQVLTDVKNAYEGLRSSEQVVQLYDKGYLQEATQSLDITRFSYEHGAASLLDFLDAERLVKRLVARELTLSFVPDAEQRLWRTVMRRKYQLTRNRVQLHNRLESLLEEAHIKLSSLVSDLLGVSARRILKALADGETNPTALAALADKKLRATSAQLCDALGACTELNPVYRQLLKMMLEELRLIDEQIGQLDREMANLLSQHQDAVARLAEVPGLGVDSAQQIIAEVGATAATFPSEKQLSSWVGACPGDNESAGVNSSHRSPKGNRHMRRILNQSANAAVKAKGTVFEIVYRRTVPRLGHQQTIGAVAHRQCRLIWKILHQGVRYEERGSAVNIKSRQKRTAKMIRELRSLGYRVEPATSQPATSAG